MSNTYESIKSKVRTEINRIIAEHGHCTPELLLEAATPKSSPIHSLFEWNNRKAAEQWRLEQASYYIRNLKIKMDCGDGKTADVREFVHFRYHSFDKETTARARGRYIQIEDAINDDELVKQMLESALSDLRAFHSKYYALKSLTGFMEAIENTLESLEQAS